MAGLVFGGQVIPSPRNPDKNLILLRIDKLNSENCLIRSRALQIFCLHFPFSRPLKYRESKAPEKSQLRFSENRASYL